MLRILSMLALGLSSYGYIDVAQAGLTSECTMSVGKQGGTKAYRCVRSSTPQEDPNFFNAFIDNHCLPSPKTRNDISPCKEAIEKFQAKEAQQNSEKK